MADDGHWRDEVEDATRRGEERAVGAAETEQGRDSGDGGEREQDVRRLADRRPRLGDPEHQPDVEDLGDEDDLDLVSEVYFARGAVFQKLGRHEDALLSLLHLVVFLPYVRDNEPRALAEALPSFAALNDWDAAYKTVQQLREKYAESPAAKQAEAFAEKYPEQMKKEADFRGVTEEETAPEEGEINEKTE